MGALTIDTALQLANLLLFPTVGFLWRISLQLAVLNQRVDTLEKMGENRGS